MLHGPNIAKRFQLLYALTLTKIIRKQIALHTLQILAKLWMTCQKNEKSSNKMKGSK